MRNHFLSVAMMLFVVSLFVGIKPVKPKTGHPIKVTFTALAYAQDAQPTPAPAKPAVPAAIDSAGGSFDAVSGVIANYSGIIGSVLGFILMVLSKVVSTEKSTPIVSQIQMIFDGLAVALQKLGNLLKAIADILSKALASDGFLGKK